MNYTPGQRFRLNANHGDVEPHADPDYEAFLDRRHPLFEGQIGEVVEVVPKEVDGAGNHDEDHVVLAFDYHHADTQDPVTGRRNLPGEFPRLVSFTEDQMTSMFTEVTEPLTASTHFTQIDGPSPPSGFSGVVS